MNSYLRINFNFNFKLDVKVDLCLFVGFIFEVEVDVEDKICLAERRQHSLNYYSQGFHYFNRQLWGCKS
jgi:hypothetical protein